jgi:hypothetical protein
MPAITFPSVELSILRDPRTLADFVIIRERATGQRLALMPICAMPISLIKSTSD